MRWNCAYETLNHYVILCFLDDYRGGVHVCVYVLALNVKMYHILISVLCHINKQTVDIQSLADTPAINHHLSICSEWHSS